MMVRTKGTDYASELRAAIERADMTLAAAADMIGVKRDTLYHWLRASSPNPAPKWALDLFRLKLKQHKR